jgi:Mitochondrial carrier protein
MASLINYKQSRYFLAGGICASFSHGIAVPFDVVKTRLQTSTTAEFLDTSVISGNYLTSAIIIVNAMHNRKIG